MKTRKELWDELQVLKAEVNDLGNIIQNPDIGVSAEEYDAWTKEYQKLLRSMEAWCLEILALDDRITGNKET